MSQFALIVQQEGKMARDYCVYMMMSASNTALYIGVTGDLMNRVLEHKSGAFKGFTRKYNCSKLVYFKEFRDIGEAIEYEKALKKKTRAKKEALIETQNPQRFDLSLNFHDVFKETKDQIRNIVARWHNPSSLLPPKPPFPRARHPAFENSDES